MSALLLRLTHSNNKQRYSDATSIRFNNNPTTSNRGRKYTFLINAAVKSNGERMALKAKCIVSKQNEIISLNVENSRWLIDRLPSKLYQLDQPLTLPF
jgi:hypothetical protein